MVREKRGRRRFRFSALVGEHYLLNWPAGLPQKNNQFLCGKHATKCFNFELKLNWINQFLRKLRKIIIHCYYSLCARDHWKWFLHHRCKVPAFEKSEEERSARQRFWRGRGGTQTKLWGSTSPAWGCERGDQQVGDINNNEGVGSGLPEGKAQATPSTAGSHLLGSPSATTQTFAARRVSSFHKLSRSLNLLEWMYDEKMDVWMNVWFFSVCMYGSAIRCSVAWRLQMGHTHYPTVQEGLPSGALI